LDEGRLKKMKCDNCQTENGYIKERKNIWFCRKCGFETPIVKEEDQDGN